MLALSSSTPYSLQGRSMLSETSDNKTTTFHLARLEPSRFSMRLLALQRRVGVRHQQKLYELGEIDQAKLEDTCTDEPTADAIPRGGFRESWSSGTKNGYVGSLHYHCNLVRSLDDHVAGIPNFALSL